jgi:hypothetical protein
LIKSGLDSVVTQDELRILINDGHDDGSIARRLRRRHSLPSLSPLTVRALRLKYGLHRRRIDTEAEVRESVADAIEEVCTIHFHAAWAHTEPCLFTAPINPQLGPYAGRGYIIGHARAVFGHSIGTKRINRATAVLAPQDHLDRTFQPRAKIRTKPFKTFYFGDTLSIDQNEKLALYVLHVPPFIPLSDIATPSISSYSLIS